MKVTPLAPLLLAALLAPAAGEAHGVAVEIDRGEGGVAARARYEGGRPLAGARYEVVSPAQPERAFEEGRTDRHGWLVFVPDAPGTWRVRIADASGHGHVFQVEVPPAPPASALAEAARPAAGAPERPAPPAAPSPSALPAALRSLLGAAALALAFGALYLVQRRRRGGR
jgi:nickel transport protein